MGQDKPISLSRGMVQGYRRYWHWDAKVNIKHKYHLAEMFGNTELTFRHYTYKGVRTYTMDINALTEPHLKIAEEVISSRAEDKLCLFVILSRFIFKNFVSLLKVL